MKITVEMDCDDFTEFMDWRKERRKYDLDVDKERRKRNIIAEKVLLAVELDQDEKHYVVSDQDHLDELAEMAIDILED